MTRSVQRENYPPVIFLKETGSHRFFLPFADRPQFSQRYFGLFTKVTRVSRLPAIPFFPHLHMLDFFSLPSAMRLPFADTLTGRDGGPRQFIPFPILDEAPARSKRSGFRRVRKKRGQAPLC